MLIVCEVAKNLSCDWQQLVVVTKHRSRLYSCHHIADLNVKLSFASKTKLRFSSFTQLTDASTFVTVPVFPLFVVTIEISQVKCWARLYLNDWGWPIRSRWFVDVGYCYISDFGVNFILEEVDDFSTSCLR